MGKFILIGVVLAIQFVFANAKQAPILVQMPSVNSEQFASAALDTAGIRKLYLDGDFDEAIELLTASYKEKRFLNHNDSVFIFKHLGVMYAANYETREKGKYFMHQLLFIEPTAKIMDMYASDMIYMIFKNIQDEFISSRSKPEGVTVPTKEDKIGKSKNPNYAKYVWMGVGAVLVGGSAVYLLLSDNPKTTTSDHTFSPP